MGMKNIETETFYRTFEFDRKAVNQEKRTISLSFSSEKPVERYFGIEVLDHSPSSIRLDRLKKRGPVLMNHDLNDQIGVVESVNISTDKMGRAVVRFSQSVRAREIWQDVVDGIRGNISVGYQIHKMVPDGEQDGKEILRAVDWEPLEISLVSVPADSSVGIGRKKNDRQTTTIMEIRMNENTENAENSKPRDLQKEGERILEIADRYDAHQLAADHLRRGSSVETFLAALADRMDATPSPNIPHIGIAGRDLKEYSLVRAIEAAASGDWSRAGVEREASVAAAHLMGRKTTGLIVPFEVLGRGLTVGTPTAGGNLVGTDHLEGQFVDVLRNKARVIEAGATVLSGLQGDVEIPRQTAAGTAYWTAENSDVTASDQAFDHVTLAPKLLGGLTTMSRKLTLQSSPDAEMLVRDDLIKVLGVEIDRAAINGSGASGQPTGILGTTGIGSVACGTDGAAPTWADVVNLVAEVAADNADSGTLGFLTNAKVRAKLLQTDKGTDTGQFVWELGKDGDGILAGYRALISNNLKFRVS